VNALANDEVGKYLNNAFVATYQKVATFQIVGNQKQGGNVASYFCLPSGRILHAIAGPVDAPTFLREMRWTVDTYKLALLEHPDDEAGLRAFFWQAHADRLRNEHGVNLDQGGGAGQLNAAGKVHLLLMASPLAKLDRLYKLVFEKILGERITTAPVARL
jgi:hypothetical protein